MATTEFAENISSSVSQDGWVEARIHKWKLGTPTVLAVQFFLTGDQNGNATYDACPDDQNTTVPTGVTTQLHYYGIFGTPTVTTCNVQFPSSATITSSDSATVYARAFGVGLTDSIGAADSIDAWIGYSATNTNPSTWTTWIPATYNTDANNSLTAGCDVLLCEQIPARGGTLHVWRIQFVGRWNMERHFVRVRGADGSGPSGHTRAGNSGRWRYCRVDRTGSGVESFTGCKPIPD
jgi:hypothetical protein